MGGTLQYHRFLSKVGAQFSTEASKKMGERVTKNPQFQNFSFCLKAHYTWNLVPCLGENYPRY